MTDDLWFFFEPINKKSESMLVAIGVRHSTCKLVQIYLETVTFIKSTMSDNKCNLSPTNGSLWCSKNIERETFIT